MRIPRLIPLLLPLLLLACAYHPDIKQGNYLTADLISQVKPGMTEAQVRFVLGPPMIRDPFHPQRWDYVYYNVYAGRGTTPTIEQRITVFFKDGKVESVAQQAPVTGTSS